MDLGLKDKVAVVAAASRGLGRAVAEMLASEGAKLAICSRNEEAIREASAAIERTRRTEVLPVVCDVTDPRQIDAFSERVLGTYGTAHILFTNAGGPPPGGVLDLGSEDYRAALDLNLHSAIHLIYAFLPAMRKQRWGRIIASTSITVKQPVGNLALSNVSRVGLIAFIKSLAGEVASARITANSVAPGYIMTDRVRQLLASRVSAAGISPEEAEREVVSQIPAGRTGSPEEFASLVTYLASEQAAYINGETLLVDGGMHRGLF